MMDIINEIDNSYVIPCQSINSLENIGSNINNPHLNLNILSFNIRSIQKNFDLFRLALRRSSLEFDIILLSECWLQEYSLVPQLAGYTSYRTHKYINRAGGVVAYIRDSIMNPQVDEPVVLEDCNCLRITIGKDVVVLGMYRSPSFPKLDRFLTSLDGFLNRVVNKTYKQCVVIAGDLNIDILSEDSNTADYLCTLSEYNLLPAISQITHDKTCLDHIFISSSFSSTGVICHTDITDHCICAASIEIRNRLTHKTKDRTKTITDEAAIKSELENEDWSMVFNKDNVNEAAAVFDTIISRVFENHTKEVTISRSKHNIKDWITPGLIRCQKKRDRLHMLAKRDPNNTVLQKEYKKYRNFLSELLYRLKISHDQQQLYKNKDNPRKLWETIRHTIETPNTRSDSAGLLPANADPRVALNNCNQYFSHVGEKLADSILTKLQTDQTQLAANFKPKSTPLSSMFLTPTEPTEVYKLIGQLKSQSAPGRDGVRAAIVKKIRNSILAPLTYIFNLSLESGCFPESWKLAVIIPIHKDGPKESPNNYRPISLLSA